MWDIKSLKPKNHNKRIKNNSHFFNHSAQGQFEVGYRPHMYPIVIQCVSKTLNQIQRPIVLMSTDLNTHNVAYEFRTTHLSIGTLLASCFSHMNE